MHGPSLVELTWDDNSATSTVAVIRMSPKELVWPVKKGKRGACRQKAATVLPNRAAAV